MYVKKLVKQTLEDLRNSVGKLPQKGEEEKEELDHERYSTVQYIT
jgi:hypothetical protein